MSHHRNVSPDATGRRPSRLRARILASGMTLVVSVGMVSACALDRPPDLPGTPVQSTAATATVLAGMAAVFEERFAGFSVSHARDFADYLAAVRPEVRENPYWPDADYALLQAPHTRSAGDPAVGLVVWTGLNGSATERSAICVEASVDRTTARLRLQQMQCPENVPPAPVQAGAPHERAETVGLASPSRRDLVTGDAAKSGAWMRAPRPAHPEPAGGPCGPGDLRSTVDSGNTVGHTDDYVLRVQNVSAAPCELSALTGLEIVRGEDTVRPAWTQGAAAVTLQPHESATTNISYRPDEAPADPQVITAHLPDGTLRVGIPAGPSATTFRVSNATPVSATPWDVTGFGVGKETWENGYGPVDIAPSCQAGQIAVTTPPTDDPSSSTTTGEDPEPLPLPYKLLNISTSTCRLDAGRLTLLKAVPSLPVPATVILQPGTATNLDIDGGAPELHGTLIIDGTSIEVNVQ